MGNILQCKRGQIKWRSLQTQSTQDQIIQLKTEVYHKTTQRKSNQKMCKTTRIKKKQGEGAERRGIAHYCYKSRLGWITKSNYNNIELQKFT